jgi:hypothetical protein
MMVQQHISIGDDESSKGNEDAIELPLTRIVYIRATVSELDDPLLPFALLKNDPLVDVQKYLDTQYPEEGIIAIRNAWNRPFHDLRSDQLFFVCAWSSMEHASARVMQMSGLSFGIASPGPFQKRWLVTRPVWRGDELVAWCEAIETDDASAEAIEEIVLSERNMLRLASLQTVLEKRVA